MLHNLCTDVWSYISIGFFRQIPVAGATGSSTMPHKVNPIRFENAEANLELSNALLDSLGSTLVTSRWQRDLTDSSAQRNIGVAFGHSVLAISNVVKGLQRLDIATDVISADLGLQLGGSGRGNPDGDARGGYRGCSRHGEPLRVSEGADPRSPRGCGSSEGVRGNPGPLPRG